MPAEREQLAKLTVSALRELAKRDLGAGTSKFRTKAQLIEALLAGGKAPAPKPKGIAAKAKHRSPPAPGLALPRMSSTAPKPKAKVAKAKPPMAPPSAVRQPDTVAPVPVQALPLDGQTLLVRWGPIALAEKGERWEVELSTEGGSTRTIPVRTRTRQTYVRALPPGPIYRAALIARTAGGARRVIGTASRPVVLFPPVELAIPVGRFVRYSWSDPLTSAGSPEVEAPGTALVAGGAPTEPAVENGSQVSPAAGAVTSWGGSLAGAPIGWLLGPRPTSFAN